MCQVVLLKRIELLSNPYHGFVLPLNYRSCVSALDQQMYQKILQPLQERHNKNGTPGLIRTDRTAPFERADFTNLSTGAW